MVNLLICQKGEAKKKEKKKAMGCMGEKKTVDTDCWPNGGNSHPSTSLTK